LSCHADILTPEALEILATVPSYQGKGAARAHLAWGAKIADAEGLPIFLEATPAGYHLYSEFGFSLVKEVEHDLALGGGKGTYSHYLMIRPAK
jgi:GNAT superfamily N-acetyltransferase